MTMLVFHVRQQAATEYTQTPTGLHDDLVTTDDGLYRVDGTTDSGALVTPAVAFGFDLSGGRQQRPEYLYAYGRGGNGLTATVETGAGLSFEYTTKIARNDVTRFELGRGLRDTYLQVGFRGTADLEVAQIEFKTQASTSRKI